MSKPFRIKIRYPKLPDSLLDVIEKSFKQKMLEAERISKKDYLSGPRPRKLGVVTGRLRNSIKISVKQINDSLKGTIGTNVKYAPVHEFGGRTGRNKSVRMPKRPFLQPALEDILPSLEKAIEKEILKDWDK
jgi:phage gpG-like protein